MGVGMPNNVASRIARVREVGRWDFGSHLRNPLVVRTGRAEGLPGRAKASRQGISGGYDRVEIPRSSSGYDLEKWELMRYPLIRLWEKIFGIPHRHDEADRVSFASRELTKQVREVSSHLKPYTEESDPLVALMTDIFNQRGMSGGK
jgi:hypothetical protein